YTSEVIGFELVGDHGSLLAFAMVRVDMRRSVESKHSEVSLRVVHVIDGFGIPLAQLGLDLFNGTREQDRQAGGGQGFACAHGVHEHDSDFESLGGQALKSSQPDPELIELPRTFGKEDYMVCLFYFP